MDHLCKKNAMKKTLVWSTLLLLVFQSLLFIGCRKSPTAEPCEKTWTSLLEPRYQIALPNTTSNYYYPHILNGYLWYHSIDGLTGVNLETGVVKSVQDPAHFRLLNGRQTEQPFLGTDENSLFQFKALDETWELLYSATDAKILDLDGIASDGLLPFVEENKSDQMQSIAVLYMASKKKLDLPKLNVLQNIRPFKVRAQPSVFVKNTTGAPDTILATLVKFLPQNTHSILIYSLKDQSIVKEIALDGLSYDHTFKIGDQFAITTAGSFYEETLVMFDPFAAKELWRETAGTWIPVNQDLFKITNSFLGGAEKVNPGNGKAYYTLPYDIDVYSAFKLSDSYCFIGREEADAIEGVRNHLVVLNNEGCELMREKIPYPYSEVSYPNGAWMYYPDSNFIMVPDNQKNLHFFRPE